MMSTTAIRSSGIPGERPSIKVIGPCKFTMKVLTELTVGGIQDLFPFPKDRTVILKIGDKILLKTDKVKQVATLKGYSLELGSGVVSISANIKHELLSTKKMMIDAFYEGRDIEGAGRKEYLPAWNSYTKRRDAVELVYYLSFDVPELFTLLKACMATGTVRVTPGR